MRRRLMGMNQVTLADRLGFSFQQLQNYEHGDNRIIASVLKEIADVFGVPVSYFFAGLEPGSDPPDETLHERKHSSSSRFYYAMPENARRRFLEVVKAAAHGTYRAESPIKV